MDAKQILKKLLQSVEDDYLYNFLFCFSRIGIKNEADNKDDYEKTRRDQINNWIDKAIKAAYEKSEENNY